MIKVRRVDFYPDEWLAGTATMDALDVGIYISACALIYSHGGPVEVTELKRFVRCHGTALKAALKRLVDAGKLTLSGSKIGSKRCENELEKARKRIEKASEDGRKGGRPRKKTKDLDKGSGFPDEKPTINQQPPKSEEYVDPDGSTAQTAPEPTPPAVAIRDPVKELWDKGVAQLGPGSRSLIGKMRREYGDLAVMDAILACEDECPSKPVEFFRKVLSTRQDNRNARQSPHAAQFAAFDEITRH